MKLKRRPEDFQVEELGETPLGSGPYALYRLTKRSIGTPEAIEELQRRWSLRREQISYGGLKDRHAVTQQFVTVRGGPARGCQTDHWQVEFLGKCGRPFTPQDIRGNRFQIVLRDMAESTAARAVRALENAARDGVPNYFDDQRFGSLGESGEFIAAAWCRGDYERALWLALAEPNPHDRPEERDQKQILREQWGDWPGCKQALERSHRRSIITFLADRPGDFRGALARIRVDLRGLYLSAFQSAVWNQLLSQMIESTVPEERLLPRNLESGPVFFYGPVDEPARENLLALKIPLPAARSRHELGRFTEPAEKVLAGFGLTLREMRVKYPRDSFFSKGIRAGTYRPSRAESSRDRDELYPGRHKVTFRCDLPRGTYATILVKHMTTGETVQTDSM